MLWSNIFSSTLGNITYTTSIFKAMTKDTRSLHKIPINKPLGQVFSFKRFYRIQSITRTKNKHGHGLPYRPNVCRITGLRACQYKIHRQNQFAQYSGYPAKILPDISRSLLLTHAAITYSSMSLPFSFMVFPSVYQPMFGV